MNKSRDYVHEAFDFEKIASVYFIRFYLKEENIGTLYLKRISNSNDSQNQEEGDVDVSFICDSTQYYLQIKSNKNTKNVTESMCREGIMQLYDAYQSQIKTKNSKFFLVYEGNSTSTHVQNLAKENITYKTKKYWEEKMIKHMKKKNKCLSSFDTFVDHLHLALLSRRDEMKRVLSRCLTTDVLYNILGELVYERKIEVSSHLLSLVRRSETLNVFVAFTENDKKKLIVHKQDYLNKGEDIISDTQNISDTNIELGCALDVEKGRYNKEVAEINSDDAQSDHFNEIFQKNRIEESKMIQISENSFCFPDLVHYNILLVSIELKIDVLEFPGINHYNILLTSLEQKIKDSRQFMLSQFMLSPRGLTTLLSVAKLLRLPMLELFKSPIFELPKAIRELSKPPIIKLPRLPMFELFKSPIFELPKAIRELSKPPIIEHINYISPQILRRGPFFQKSDAQYEKELKEYKKSLKEYRQYKEIQFNITNVSGMTITDLDLYISMISNSTSLRVVKYLEEPAEPTRARDLFRHYDSIEAIAASFHSTTDRPPHWTELVTDDHSNISGRCTTGKIKNKEKYTSPSLYIRIPEEDDVITIEFSFTQTEVGEIPNQQLHIQFIT